ncbi:MAG: methionyl-tRNA formyltransferase, partial [Bacteroidetes bacterium]|nr:methionyl-tRNA formyltransferase [Bacteroidota bacterium]
MNPNPRIVFMGTPGFALGVLQTLIARKYNIVGVVSVPDKPSGRGQRMHPSQVSVYAREHGLPLAQPAFLKDPDFLA